MPEDKYCTRKLAKEYCGDIEGVEDDLFLDALISGASRFVDGYTHVYWGPSAVISAERVRSVLGKHDDVFYTEFAPIISVTSLADDDDAYVEDTDYVVFAREGRIQLLGNTASGATITSFSESPGQLRITYVAGQGAAKTGSYTSGIAAPEDIQVACAMLAGNWYQARDRDEMVAKSENNRSVAYHLSDIPVRARAILNRRVRNLF